MFTVHWSYTLSKIGLPHAHKLSQIQFILFILHNKLTSAGKVDKISHDVFGQNIKRRAVDLSGYKLLTFQDTIFPLYTHSIQIVSLHTQHAY